MINVPIIFSILIWFVYIQPKSGGKMAWQYIHWYPEKFEQCVAFIASLLDDYDNKGCIQDTGMFIRVRPWSNTCILLIVKIFKKANVRL